MSAVADPDRTAGEDASVARRAWTDEQRRAIDRRTGDLLLDAAAGSGKTSVLVERFVRSVLDDGVAVGAILTITFTEKAAAELRDRIRTRLRELGADAAARATEGAFISTIHGFCARVLRGHALAAGLDPRFEVLAAERTEPLAADAFDAALAQLAQDDPGVVDLIAAYTVPTLRAAILSAHDALRSGGAIEPGLPQLAPPPGPEVSVALHTAAAALAAELGAIADPGARVLLALDRVARVAELGDPAQQWPAELWAYALPKNGAALCTDACAAYTEALAAYRAASAAHAAGPVRDRLHALLEGFSARYAAAKAEVSGLDFVDLELFARRLLAEDDALRERYRERFAAIMVDELQDTNRVQLELIESIASDNLFTVGDAQQSIYGFRHADVELFAERGRRLARSGARETLRTNFRTRPEIIDVLNPTFAEAMGEAFTPLHAGRGPADDGDPGPHVELLVADKGADWDLEGMASPWRLAEARALARRVAALVADGTAPGQIVVLMRASTDMRAYERALEREGLPTYVIGGRGYWAHPQVVDMVAYLRALANPRDEEPLYGVLASPLVGLSLDGLVVLADRARSTGRDPWSVLRDGEALASLGADDARRLGTFTGWFAAERARLARTGIEELVERALTITGYDLEMLAMPGGRRRLANVRKLMRLGRGHEATHGPDLRGFLGLIADREAGRSADTREGEAPMEGDGLDAIRMMTIHRAKGLEFDVVCVADLGRSPRPPAEILRVSGDGRLGLRLVRAGTGGRESALDYTVLGDEARAAEEREERRLFYVAMTRARERLLLSGAARLEAWAEGNPRAGGGPIAWIAPAITGGLAELGALVRDEAAGEARCGEGRVAVTFATPGEPEAPGATAPAPVPAQTTPGASASAVHQETPAGALKRPPEPTPAPPPVETLSYSSLAEYQRCGYRFYAERVLGLPARRADADAQRRDPGGGRRRGILVHALLERLDFRRPVAPAAHVARAAAVRGDLQPPPGPAELDALAAIVRQFADSELCARLAAADEVRREQRFAFALDDDPAHPLVVGALDVLARESSAGRRTQLVVDYKTDRLDGADPAALVARDYAGQQLVYAIAALQTGAPAVEIVHCFLAEPESPVSARFGAGELGDLRERLRARAQGVVAGRFEVAPDPHRRLCAGCPAEGGLCSWPTELTRRESADTLF